MRFTKKDEGLPQIMVIPMIDIMFFLLVFFMLATINMSNSGWLNPKVPSLPAKYVCGFNGSRNRSEEHTSELQSRE